MIPLLLLACARPTPLPEAPVVPAETLQSEGRVILVTIDGVRWQEATTRMPAIDDWAVFGDRSAGSRVNTSSRTPLSLPGYHALMTGHTTDCDSNRCGRMGIETLPESLVRRLDLPRLSVGVFASWVVIPSAAASTDSPPFVLDSETSDAAPWPNARTDAETWARAMDFLTTQQPRFLWISLLDSDEHAHREEWDGYLSAIDQYSAWMTELQQTVDDLGLTEQTTIILTTDHGRGRGPFWHSHGRLPAGRHMFLAATGPWVGVSGTVVPEQTVRQADVRPTIERLLGLEPTPCDQSGCGTPIPGLVPR